MAVKGLNVTITVTGNFSSTTDYPHAGSQACACIIQPGSFKGWGSGGVNLCWLFSSDSMAVKGLNVTITVTGNFSSTTDYPHAGSRAALYNE